MHVHDAKSMTGENQSGRRKNLCILFLFIPSVCTARTTKEYRWPKHEPSSPLALSTTHSEKGRWERSFQPLKWLFPAYLECSPVKRCSKRPVWRQTYRSFFLNGSIWFLTCWNRIWTLPPRKRSASHRKSRKTSKFWTLCHILAYISETVQISIIDSIKTFKEH